jgi:RNA polymerase sigma factor
VLALKGPPRRAPSTSCSAVASPEKQRTAKLPPPQRPSRVPAAEEGEGEGTDYNEVAAALESIYKLSPAVVEEKHGEDDEAEKDKKKRKGRVVSISGSTSC